MLSFLRVVRLILSTLNHGANPPETALAAITAIRLYLSSAQ